MHYELTDREWTAIKPMLPNTPRVPRVNDRRVLNGIFGSCGLGHRGATYRIRSAFRPLAKTASFVGGALASGAGSSTH